MNNGTQGHLTRLSSLNENDKQEHAIGETGAQMADGVQRALGREPRAFSDFARKTAATGVGLPDLAVTVR